MPLTGHSCRTGCQIHIPKRTEKLELLRRNDWLYDPQAVAVAISLAIAFATVLWQTLKAARTNPATELKKE